MNLVLVTFNIDNTQFLMDVDEGNLSTAFDLAIKTNKRLESDEVLIEDIEDIKNYTLESVDFKMLADMILLRDDVWCVFDDDNVVVFYG